MRHQDEAAPGALDELRTASAKGFNEQGSTSSGDTIAGNTSTSAAIDPRTLESSIQSGWVNTPGDTDWYRMPVTAGTRYTIILTGAAPTTGGGAALASPTVRVYDAAGQLIGSTASLNGFSTSYQLTATTTGFVFVSAEGTNGTTGRYITSVLASAAPAPDTVPGDASTSASVAIGGSVNGAIDSAGDADWFRVTLQAGVIYDFSLTATGDLSLDPLLELRDANGVVLTRNDDFGDGLDSRLTFVPTVSGTYFLAATDYSNDTGSYRLTAAVGAPNDIRSTLDWGTRLPGDNVIHVYFIPAGQTQDGQVSVGWNDYEIGRAMAALAGYSAVTPLSFIRTEDPGQAELRLLLANELDGEFGYFYAPGEPQAGLGVFSRGAPGWDEAGGGGLEFGGLGFTTLVHEFGHALGLAHPHDTGGSSTVMIGVNDPFDSLGWFDLNQGVFTTLTYNDGWRTGPDGLPLSDNWGLQAGPMALDIAVLQRTYGANTGYRTGDDLYLLPTADQLGTGFLAVWDAGGIDTFEYRGAAAAVIDLRAATIDYSATGGGVVSFARGVHGGFTIAAGVVIENATGGSGADRLRGNSGANLLDGRDGDDRLEGAEGDDDLRGGRGSDVLDGGLGADRLRGDDGDDVLNGQAGADNLDGGQGRDQLFGDAGDDLIVGWIDDDRLHGGDGDDLIGGQDGADYVEGGSGRDRLYGDAGDDLIVGGLEDDFIDGGLQNDLIGGQDGNDLVVGGGGADRLYGDAGDDLIGGQDGDDFVDGGAGRDELYGDVGNDLVVGGAENDRLFGQDGDDLMGGQDGDDRVDGGSGRDRLYGDAGDDLVVGGSEDDFIDGGAGGDLIGGQDGNDLVLGGGGGDRLYGDAGDDLIGGQDGDDFVHGGAGRDELYGDAGADTVVGGIENDRLFGQEGDDLIGGQDGADFVDGGSGRDRLYGDAGDDLVVGGAEDDFIDGGLGDDLIGGQDGNDLVVGGGGQDRLYGDTGDDLIGGQDGDDFVDGGAGRDELYGDAGRDTVVGGGDGDRLFGGDGDDLMGGQNGDDLVDGGAGRDELYGDAGDDRLLGGAGDDRIFGGDGLDTAVFAGPRSAYAVTIGDGSITIAGADGTDVLFGVERLEFADGVAAPTAEGWVL